MLDHSFQAKNKLNIFADSIGFAIMGNYVLVADLHGEPFAQCQNFFATGKAYEHFISNCNFNLMIMNVEIKKRELCFSIFPPLL